MNRNPVIDTDVAIIGSGTGGMSAYREALEHTSRVGCMSPEASRCTTQAPLRTPLAGASHAELSAAGVAFETGHLAFDDQGRSRVIGRNLGALHVYGELGTSRFLGAEMLGPAAEHIGHVPAWSVQRSLHRGPGA